MGYELRGGSNFCRCDGSVCGRVGRLENVIVVQTVSLRTVRSKLEMRFRGSGPSSDVAQKW